MLAYKIVNKKFYHNRADSHKLFCKHCCCTVQIAFTCQFFRCSVFVFFLTGFLKFTNFYVNNIDNALQGVCAGHQTL